MTFSRSNVPKSIYATGESIRNLFRYKLDEFFELYATLAAESNRTINSLNLLADSFRESGSDYLDAATAFNQCNFAADLQQSVEGLKESRQEIILSTKTLLTVLCCPPDCLVISLFPNKLFKLFSKWS